MHFHSASERSVGYVFLMRARVANRYLTHPFQTVSEGVFPETRLPVRNCPKSPDRPGTEASKGLETGQKALLSPLETNKMEALEITLDPFRTVSERLSEKSRTSLQRSLTG